MANANPGKLFPGGISAGQTGVKLSWVIRQKFIDPSSGPIANEPLPVFGMIQSFDFLARAYGFKPPGMNRKGVRNET
jgi:hypothetical protein